MLKLVVQVFGYLAEWLSVACMTVVACGGCEVGGCWLSD